MRALRQLQIVGVALLLAGFLALFLLDVGVAAITWAYMAVPIALAASLFHLRYESIHGLRRGLYIASLCLVTVLFVLALVATFSGMESAVRALLEHTAIRLSVFVSAIVGAILGLFGRGWSRAVMPIAALCSAILVLLPYLIS